MIFIESSNKGRKWWSDEQRDRLREELDRGEEVI